MKPVKPVQLTYDQTEGTNRRAYRLLQFTRIYFGSYAPIHSNETSRVYLHQETLLAYKEGERVHPGDSERVVYWKVTVPPLWPTGQFIGPGGGTVDEALDNGCAWLREEVENRLRARPDDELGANRLRHMIDYDVEHQCT